MPSKGPPNPMPREGIRSVAIGGSAIGNAFGAGSSVIYIAGDNNGQIGETLTNCSNMVQSQRPSDRKAILESLQHDVRTLIENLPDDRKGDAPQVAKDLEMLVAQATSEKPNRRWYSVSAEGLLEASNWVKDFTGNISSSISKLGKQLWPDFSL